MENNIQSASLSKIKDFIINSCASRVMVEVCGFIGFDEQTNSFIATVEKNRAEDPKSFFLIGPESFLQFKNKYKLLGVFHSHIVADESPSEFDIKMAEACCFPFIIYSLNSKKFHIYEPQNQDYDVNIFARIKEKLQ